MKKNRPLTLLQPALLLLLSSLLTPQLSVQAQGTAFTYQGQLNTILGPANGAYDLRFALFDDPVAGNQVGAAVTNVATSINNGLFTVTLDFGDQFPGAPRWLEMQVRTNSGPAFGTLSPRQAVNSSPYTVRAGTAGAAATAGSAATADSVDADDINGTLLINQLPAIVLTNGSSLNASSLASGTVADVRLSTNVALRTGGNTFSGPQFFTNGNVGIRANPGGNGLQINTNFHPANGYGLLVNDADFGANIQINRAAGETGIGLVIDNSANGDATTSMLLLRNNYDPGSWQDVLNVRANGNVGIGTFTPGFPLNFASSTGDKVSLWGNASNHFGFGIQNNLLQIHTDDSGSDIAFGHGQSTNLTERMRIKGTGNVGIGTVNPGSNKLQINTNFHFAGGWALQANSADFGANIQINRTNGGIGLAVDNSANGDASTSLLVVRNNVSGGTQNLFNVLGSGNVGIGISPTNKLHVAGGVSATAFVTTSDRHAKENFAPVSPQEVLNKVAALPITTWNFKQWQDGRHMGPMAQDFYDAFGLGGGDTTITSVDTDGVALAAIQGLNQVLQATRAENAELKARLEKLEQRLNDNLNRDAK